MATIKAVLDLDISQFSSKAGAAGHVLSESLSADTNKVLKRKFGYDDALKGLLMGAGLGGVEQIAEKIAEHWKAAAEAAKEIAESSKRTLDNYLSAFSARRTDAQNLDFNRKEQGRLQRELAGLKPEETTRSILGADFSVRTVSEVTDEAKEKAAQRRTEIVEELSKLAREEQDLAKKISETKKQEDEKVESARKRYREADREAQLVTLANEAKLRRMQEERRTLLDELDGLDENTVAHYEKKNELAKLDVDLARTALEIARQRDQIEQKQRSYGQASVAMGEAANARFTAKGDRYRLSLEDAAAGKGNSTDQARARQILALEARARSTFANDNQMLDYDGKPIGAGRYARRLMDRADDLRRYSRFKSDAQDPLAASGKALENAAEKLERAADDLAKVEATVEVAP